MSQVCNVLDILGKVAWRVNPKILDVIEYIWASGGGAADIPERFNKQTVSPDDVRKANIKDKLKLLAQYQENNELHSLRCHFLLRLSMA